MLQHLYRSKRTLGVVYAASHSAPRLLTCTPVVCKATTTNIDSRTAVRSPPPALTEGDEQHSWQQQRMSSRSGGATARDAESGQPLVGDGDSASARSSALQGPIASSLSLAASVADRLRRAVRSVRGAPQDAGFELVRSAEAKEQELDERDATGAAAEPLESAGACLVIGSIRHSSQELSSAHALLGFLAEVWLSITHWSARGPSPCRRQLMRLALAGWWQPEESAGLLSRLVFSYCNGILKLGSRKILVQDDLWDVSRWAGGGLVSHLRTLARTHGTFGGVRKAGCRVKREALWLGPPLPRS